MSEKNYMLQKNDSNRYLQLSEYEPPEIPEPPEQDDNTFLEDCGVAVKEKKVGYLTLYYPFKTLITETVADSGTTHFDFTIDTNNDTFEGVMKSSSIEKVNSRIGSQYGQSRVIRIKSEEDEIKLVITGKNHKSETVTETITSDITRGTIANTTNFYKEITSITVSGNIPEDSDLTEEVTLDFAPVFKLDNFDYKYVKDNALVSVETYNIVSMYSEEVFIYADDDSETPNETGYIEYSSSLMNDEDVFDDTVLPTATLRIVEK